MAKYESRAGERILSCIQARYGVSHRTNGNSLCLRLYRHRGSLRLSAQMIKTGSISLMACIGDERMIQRGWARTMVQALHSCIGRGDICYRQWCISIGEHLELIAGAIWSWTHRCIRCSNGQETATGCLNVQLSKTGE
jgi:hypothetical protein